MGSIVLLHDWDVVAGLVTNDNMMPVGEDEFRPLACQSRVDMIVYSQVVNFKVYYL